MATKSSVALFQAVIQTLESWETAPTPPLRVPSLVNASPMDQTASLEWRGSFCKTLLQGMSLSEIALGRRSFSQMERALYVSEGRTK
jgi:hypothetical protein